MQNFSKTRHIATVTLLVAIFFIWGVYLGIHKKSEIEKVVGLAGKETLVTTKADFSPFWKTWNTINEKYPKASTVEDQSRVYGAISGLVDSLNDPYSVFFGPDEAKSFEEEIAGNFSGVGMEVGIKDKTVPTGLSIEHAIKLMSGEKGTTVILSISREGRKDPIEMKIVRDTINIPTLDTELRKDGIFIIRLYSFSGNSTNLFREAMKKFAESGTDKMLLDLRGNPGGYLEAAVDIASWFLPSQKIIATEDYGNNKKAEVFRSKGYNIFNDKQKFVILIDGGSASASEIVAGAMRDHGRAKLVGSQSFGKGSVQEAIKITPDTLLKITVAKWLTPNGTSISEKGLTPDYVVEFTPKNINDKKDVQLEKAVEVLLQ